MERKKGNYREISLKFLLFFLFLDGKRKILSKSLDKSLIFGYFLNIFPRNIPILAKERIEKGRK
jgi:hypothetical protein